MSKIWLKNIHAFLRYSDFRVGVFYLCLRVICNVAAPYYAFRLLLSLTELKQLGENVVRCTARCLLFAVHWSRYTCHQSKFSADVAFEISHKMILHIFETHLFITYLRIETHIRLWWPTSRSCSI